MNNLKLFLGLFILLGIFACGTDSPTDANTKTTELTKEQLTGTYSFGSENGEDAGGTLAVQVLENKDIKFELTLHSGEPNNHIGTASGTIPIKGNLATWYTSEYSDNGCIISFTFNENEVIINQEKGAGMDCGLGASITAIGVLQKIKEVAEFPYEDEINAALKEVSTNIGGDYETAEPSDYKNKLSVEKLTANKIKIKYQLSIHTKEPTIIEAEIPLNDNVALYQNEEDCSISFIFKANKQIEVKMEAGNNQSCPIAKPHQVDGILTKVKDNTH